MRSKATFPIRLFGFGREARSRSLPNTDRDWERYGREEPYFGVYADPRFRRRNLTRPALEEFFASGEKYASAVFDVIGRHFRADFRPKRTLDFGCGVGRLLAPLASRSDSVVGADVSASMLAEARRNLEERGAGNVDLVLVNDSLAGVGSPFDLVNSFIVFQHLGVKRGERLCARLIDLLGEGGLGVLHFTYSNDLRPRQRLKRWARRSLPLVHNVLNLLESKALGSPWMQMNAFDLNRIFRLLQDRGCHRCHVAFTDHSGHRGVVLFFEKSARPSFA